MLRTKIDGYDFSRKFAITESAQKIILGFDPSTSFAGVSLYDAANDSVLEYEGLDPDQLKEWLMEMLRVYASERGRILARLEVPVKATAYAHARDTAKAMKAAKAPHKRIEVTQFNIVWGSAMCFDQARRFIKIVEGLLPYELIASEHRMNCLNNRLLKGKSPKEMEQWFRAALVQTGKPWFFPTKMPAVAMKHFWPELKVVGDDDLRDALCCSFPEKLFKLVT